MLHFQKVSTPSIYQLHVLTRAKNETHLASSTLGANEAKEGGVN